MGKIPYNYVTNEFKTGVDNLPFYVATTGVARFKKGHIKQNDRLISRKLDLCWSIRGTGKVRLGGAEAVIGKDQIFLRYPGEESQKIALSEEWEFRWLSLAGPLACAVVMSYGFPRFMSSYTPYPEKLFARLDELCADQSLFSQRRAAAVVLDILAHADGYSMHRSAHERLIVNAVEYIRSNLSDPELSVEQLAERFHVSRTTLNKVFREHSLPSPGRRILDCRLLRARELIYGTDLPVSEMSRMCGFADPHTFTRFIRRALGAPPLQLRKGSSPADEKSASAAGWKA